MMGNDEDRDRSRRPDAEDRGWSSIGRVLDGRTIKRSGDTVCGLHYAQGDEKRGFLGLASEPRSTVSPDWASKPVTLGFPVWASKPTATVWWFGPQNHHDGLLVWASKPSGLRFVSCVTKPTGG
jgi:hypothetical protein